MPSPVRRPPTTSRPGAGRWQLVAAISAAAVLGLAVLALAASAGDPAGTPPSNPAPSAAPAGTATTPGATSAGPGRTHQDDQLTPPVTPPDDGGEPGAPTPTDEQGEGGAIADDTDVVFLTGSGRWRVTIRHDARLFSPDGEEVPDARQDNEEVREEGETRAAADGGWITRDDRGRTARMVISERWLAEVEHTGPDGDVQRYDPPRPIVPLRPEPGTSRTWQGTVTRDGETRRAPEPMVIEVIELVRVSDGAGHPWDTVHLRVTLPRLNGDGCSSEGAVEAWWSLNGAVPVRTVSTVRTVCPATGDELFDQEMTMTREAVLVRWQPDA